MTIPVTATPRQAWFDEPEPAWEIARLFPAQGHWTPDDYLTLDTNLRVEFSHGIVEVQEMPTEAHQLIIAYLYGRLQAFTAASHLGITLFAGIRVLLAPGKFREPDIVFMHHDHADRRGQQSWQGADLVMEVVSDDRERDLVTKRREYAQAGIPEYWIVDPRDRQILVLRLAGDSYVVHAAAGLGETATSALLPGFSVTVADVFEAAR